MTHRERAIKALAGGQPDYVPTFELVFHETERDFQGRKFYGTPFEPNRAGRSDKDLFEYNARLYIDVARRFQHSIIYVSPLAWPYTAHYRDVVAMVRLIREWTGDEFCVMAPGDPTFKIPRDPWEFSMRLYDEPDTVAHDAQKRLDTVIPTYDAVMDAGADGIIMTSDYAFNSGTFLTPEQFSEFVTPYLKRACREVQDRGGVVVKHSDGNLMPVLEQIVEAGPDAIHSIDPMAGMDIRKIKETYGGRVALCGNVHCAWMQTGTAEQIRESAEYCLAHAKPGGGYVFCTSNCVFRGMPLESYDLIHQVWLEHRQY